MTDAPPKRSCLKKKGYYDSHVSQLTSPETNKKETSYLTTISARATEILITNKYSKQKSVKILAPSKRQVTSNHRKTFSKAKHNSPSTVLFRNKAVGGNETPPRKKSPPRITNGRRIPLIPGYSHLLLSPERDSTQSTRSLDLVKQTKKESVKKKQRFYAFSPKMAPMLNVPMLQCKKEETTEKSKPKHEKNVSNEKIRLPLKSPLHIKPERELRIDPNIKSSERDTFSDFNTLIIQQRQEQKPLAHNLSKKMKNLDSADNSRDVSINYVVHVHRPFKEKNYYPVSKENIPSSSKSLTLMKKEREPSHSPNMESTDLKTNNQEFNNFFNLNEQKPLVEKASEEIKIHHVADNSATNNNRGTSTTDLGHCSFTENKCTLSQENESPNKELIKKDNFSDLNTSVIQQRQELKPPMINMSKKMKGPTRKDNNKDMGQNDIEYRSFTENDFSSSQEKISSLLPKFPPLVKNERELRLLLNKESAKRVNSSDQNILISEEGQDQKPLLQNTCKKIKTAHDSDQLMSNNNGDTETMQNTSAEMKTPNGADNLTSKIKGETETTDTINTSLTENNCCSSSQEPILPPPESFTLIKRERNPLVTPIMESTERANTSNQNTLIIQEGQEQMPPIQNIRIKLEAPHSADSLTINNDSDENNAVTEQSEHRLRRNDYQSFVITKYSSQQFFDRNKQRVHLDSVIAYFKFRKTQKRKSHFTVHKRPLFSNPVEPVTLNIQ